MNYLNKVEAAKFLGVSRNTFDLIVKENKIPFVKIGRTYKFDEKDLKKFIDDQKKLSIQ